MKKPTANKKKWIEIIPYGIVGGMIPDVSTMLFKKKSGEGRFAVWLSELQSRMAIEQSLKREKVFDFAHKILKINNSLPQECYFLKHESGRDLVRLCFNKRLKSLNFYADEVVSFCMMGDCRFFCQAEFFKRPPGDIPLRFKKKVSNEKPMYLN